MHALRTTRSGPFQKPNCNLKRVAVKHKYLLVFFFFFVGKSQVPLVGIKMLVRGERIEVRAQRLWVCRMNGPSMAHANIRATRASRFWASTQGC